MKWSIDWLLNKFFIFVKQLSLIFSKIFLNSLSKPVDFFFKGVSAVIVFILFILTAITSNIVSFFNFSIKSFITPFLDYFIDVIDGFFPKFKPAKKIYTTLYNFSKFLYIGFTKLVVLILSRLYKRIIDFFFLTFLEIVLKLKIAFITF